MSNIIASYGNLAFLNTGKQGILKQLDSGYSELLLGAIGAAGNGGWIYDEKGCEAYLMQNKDFRDRLQSGKLKMEWGHPERMPGMTDLQWLQRIHTVLESNTCAHIRQIHLSRNTLRDLKGRPVVAIIGEVCPWGKQAGEFRLMLENPHGDVNSSVRSFTDNNPKTGRKIFTNVITWDHVTTPGIKETTKYNTPSMESNELITHQLDQCEFHLDELRDELIRTSECAISLESRAETLAQLRVLEAGYNSSRLPSGIASW